MRYICHWRLRSGESWGLQREERQFTGRMKRVNVWLTDICWAILKQWDVRGLLSKRPW